MPASPAHVMWCSPLASKCCLAVGCNPPSTLLLSGLIEQLSASPLGARFSLD